MVDFSERGCTLVDTTCGSVLNVWKNVVRYAQDGFTAIIHGKVKHEETRATASQALKYPQGRYLVVLDRERGRGRLRLHPPRRRPRRRSSRASPTPCRPGFDPDVDLVRVGCANQTTMLMSESLEIGEMVGAAMRDRYGEAALAPHFRAFDTICSATQERQDAVEALLDSRAARPDDRGRRLQQQQHVQPRADLRGARAHVSHRGSGCLLSAERIRHRPVGAPSTAEADEVVTENWLPANGRVVVGLTAGASTPNNIVGQVIETIERFALYAGSRLSGSGSQLRRLEVQRSSFESCWPPTSVRVMRTWRPFWRARKRWRSVPGLAMTVASFRARNSLRRSRARRS